MHDEEPQYLSQRALQKTFTNIIKIGFAFVRGRGGHLLLISCLYVMIHDAHPSPFPIYKCQNTAQAGVQALNPTFEVFRNGSSA